MSGPTGWTNTPVSPGLSFQTWRIFPGVWAFQTCQELPPEDPYDDEIVSWGWAIGRRDATRAAEECTSGEPPPPVTWYDLPCHVSVSAKVGRPAWWVPRIACVDGALSVGWLVVCVAVQRIDPDEVPR